MAEGLYVTPAEFVADVSAVQGEWQTLSADFLRTYHEGRLPANVGQAWESFLANTWNPFIVQAEEWIRQWNALQEPSAQWDPRTTFRRPSLLIELQSLNQRLEEMKSHLRRWRQTLIERGGTPSAPDRPRQPTPAEGIPGAISSAVTSASPLIIGAAVLASIVVLGVVIGPSLAKRAA